MYKFQEFSLGSVMDDADPSTWAIPCCLPGWSLTELGLDAKQDLDPGFRNGKCQVAFCVCVCLRQYIYCKNMYWFESQLPRVGGQGEIFHVPIDFPKWLQWPTLDQVASILKLDPGFSHGWQAPRCLALCSLPRWISRELGHQNLN